jgi:UDP-hydrolysing UDP-N-acetyl-D-glucosamine 2-epimerase
MTKRKVCFVITNRATYGRVKSVLLALREHGNIELITIAAGALLLGRYGEAVDYIKRDGIDVQATVKMVVEGEDPATMAKSTGLCLLELPTVFDQFRPDIVVTAGDRYETLATAIAATYMNIPLGHVLAGEVSGSIDNSVRHAITRMAHLHFAPTRLSAERIVRMGEDPKTVFFTGCPSIDLLIGIDFGTRESLSNEFGGVVDPQKPLIVFMQHPVTTEYEQSNWQIKESLKALKELGVQTIAIYPNVDAGADLVIKGIRQMDAEAWSFMRWYKHLPLETFYRLMKHCDAFVGNSSAGLREGAYLGTPVVNIGTRQDGRERGPNVVDVPHDSIRIRDAILSQLEHGTYPQDLRYGEGKAGHRIASILANNNIPKVKRMTY